MGGGGGRKSCRWARPRRAQHSDPSETTRGGGGPRGTGGLEGRHNAPFANRACISGWLPAFGDIGPLTAGAWRNLCASQLGVQGIKVCDSRYDASQRGPRLSSEEPSSEPLKPPVLGSQDRREHQGGHPPFNHIKTYRIFVLFQPLSRFPNLKPPLHPRNKPGSTSGPPLQPCANKDK